MTLLYCMTVTQKWGIKVFRYLKVVKRILDYSCVPDVLSKRNASA